WDNTTRLWDPIAGHELVVGGGVGLKFSRDGRRLGFVRQPRYGVWRLAESAAFQAWHAGRAGNQTPWQNDLGPAAVDFSRDGRLLASAAGDGVRLWDVGRGQERARLRIGFSESAQFSPHGDALLTIGTSGLTLWPMA